MTPDITRDRGPDVLSHALHRRVIAGPSRNGKPTPITVEIGDRSYRLRTIWVGRGWPSDLEILQKITRPWPRELVVTAREFSPGALEQLAALDANWADESGRVRIEGPKGLLIQLEPPPAPPREEKRSFRWSHSAEQLAEYVLASGPNVLNAAQIAKETGWSHAQVSSILQRFDKQGWTEKSGAARGRHAVRRLADPASLLEAWAEHIGTSERERVLAHRPLRDPMSFLRQELAPALAQSMPWAVSGWAGLEVSAPFVTAVPVLHVYVPAEAIDEGRLDAAIKATGLRQVDEGARVEFWGASDLALKLAKRADAIPVVSAPRLYADLRSFGGRGEDAAQHVRQELIGF
jgi:transcriptional regulator with AbiEi antitoxin domain of type IV toxin-antitoxin system